MEVAWNQVKVNDLVSSPSERERLFAEIRVLKQLKHKNIMGFFHSWLDQKAGFGAHEPLQWLAGRTPTRAERARTHMHASPPQLTNNPPSLPHRT